MGHIGHFLDTTGRKYAGKSERASERGSERHLDGGPTNALYSPSPYTYPYLPFIYSTLLYST